MIIRSLRQHWPARKLEWIMMGALLSWGLYTLLHPEIFTNPATGVATAYMREMVSNISEYPALVWGGAATTVAMMRGIALFINGAWTRTPLIRAVMAALSVFIFFQIFLGLMNSGVSNWGIVVYPWLVVCDILSAFRAAVDVVHAEAQRATERENRFDARSAARIA